MSLEQDFEMGDVVEELVDAYHAAIDERDALKAVLEFYANEENWDGRMLCHYGPNPEPHIIARQALKELEESVSAEPAAPA